MYSLLVYYLSQGEKDVTLPDLTHEDRIVRVNSEMAQSKAVEQEWLKFGKWHHIL